MKIYLAVVQKKKGEILFCHIATILKSMEDMQKHFKLILIRMFSNQFFFFFSKYRKTNQVIIHKGQIISSLPIPNRSNYIKEGNME